MIELDEALEPFTEGIEGRDDAALVSLFERVRDLPFAFAPHDDPLTLLRCGFGTCGPKHALLRLLYERLGVATRFVYVTFRFEEMPGDFPAELRAALHDGVVRAHAALQIERDGRWIDVDATFDRPLARAGFTVREAWDGRTSMPLVVRPLARVETMEPPERENMLLGLTHDTRIPGALVARLNAWLGSLRAGR